MTVFCTPSTLPASRVAWRKARHQLRALIDPQSKASNLDREANERFQKARAALAQAQGRDRKLVRKEFVKCTEDADRIREECRRINERQRNLTTTVQLLEASIARRELFRFLKSKRYELNPLSLAHAAAGLPEMGYRRSTAKCAKCRSTPTEGLRYEIFKAIRYLISKADNKTAQGLVEHFRKTVLLLPQRYARSKADFAENWFFLERALRQICKARPHPKAFPYEVTARYFKQMQVRSYPDMLLAERAKLTLSKRA